jgi:hypothetical protein
VHKEYKEPRDILEHKVTHSPPSEQKVLREHRVPKDFKVPKVLQQGTLEHRVLKVLKVLLELKAQFRVI